MSVLGRGPTYAESVVIEVVAQMLKEERKPAIRAQIQKSGGRQVTDEDVLAALTKLVAATDNDEGVCLTPWEAISIGAYLQRLELAHRGERYW